MSNFFRNIPLAKTTPLILTVIFTAVVLFFLSQFNLRAAKKPIKDLFTYLDGKDYEKAYHQYSEKAHEMYGVSPDYFANFYKGTTRHEILSITAIPEESLSKLLNQSEAFKKMAQDFSFQEYQNKKLFRVEFYTENPETDIQLYEELERYCSSPGIVVDAYFGVVQMDAFTWKILFFHILGSKCKGKNKYAEYKAEERRKTEEAWNRIIAEQRKKEQEEKERIMELNTLRFRFKNECPKKFFYKDVPKYERPKYRRLGGIEAEWNRKERLYKDNLSYLEYYKADIKKYCECLFDEIKDDSYKMSVLLDDFEFWPKWKLEGYEASCGKRPEQFYLDN